MPGIGSLDWQAIPAKFDGVQVLMWVTGSSATPVLQCRTQMILQICDRR